MRGLLADPAGAGGNPVMTHKTLNTVQALRAIAAAGVLAYHVVYVMGHRAGYSLNDSSLGESGVDLFFVISGFIMIYTTAGSFNEPNASLAFMRRRIIRIVPLYWLCTTGIVLLLAFFPACSQASHSIGNRLFRRTCFACVEFRGESRHGHAGRMDAML